MGFLLRYVKQKISLAEGYQKHGYSSGLYLKASQNKRKMSFDHQIVLNMENSPSSLAHIFSYQKMRLFKLYQMKSRKL